MEHNVPLLATETEAEQTKTIIRMKLKLKLIEMIIDN